MSAVTPDGGPLGPWLLVVDVEVDQKVEDEWNQWYDNVHLPSILACPGFRTGSRYKADATGTPRYLTVYQLERPDAVDTPEFAAARGWERFGGHVRFSTRSYTQVQA